MSELPKLPPPPPQLDFPAMEAMRQQMVTAYRAMLSDLQVAMARIIDGAPGTVKKSTAPGFIEGAIKPQEDRRARIVKVLRRLGTPASHFGPGGDLFNTSDNELRDLAKQALAARRKP